MSDGNISPFDYSKFGASPTVGQQTTLQGSPAAPGNWNSAGPFSTGFSHETDRTPLKAVSPPTIWLFSGAALAVLTAIISLFFGSDAVITAVCWALGGPIAIALFARFTWRDNSLRVNLLYAAPTWLSAAYRAGLSLSFISLVISAVHFAFSIGRL